MNIYYVVLGRAGSLGEWFIPFMERGQEPITTNYDVAVDWLERWSKAHKGAYTYRLIEITEEELVDG